MINGVYAAGGAFGCAFNMWSSEYFGRKRSIQIGCCISIVGATIMTAAVGIPMFVVARFVMGFGIGVLVTLVPLYVEPMAQRIGIDYVEVTWLSATLLTVSP